MTSVFSSLFPKPITYHNLVFKGSGIHGIAYLSAMEVLEERSIMKAIERVAGILASTTMALLVSYVDQHRTIAISDCVILATDFSIVKGDERNHKLQEAGRKAALAFLEKR